MFFFFFSSRRRHTRLTCDWSSDVCSSEIKRPDPLLGEAGRLVEQRDVGLDLARRVGTLNLDRDALAVRKHGVVYLPDRGRRSRLLVELEEGLLDGYAELLRDHAFDVGERDRPHVVLKLLQLEHDVGRNDVGTGREQLAELDEGRAELVEHLPQTAAPIRGRLDATVPADPRDEIGQAVALEEVAESMLDRDLRDLGEAADVARGRTGHAVSLTRARYAASRPAAPAAAPQRRPRLPAARAAPSPCGRARLPPRTRLDFAAGGRARSDRRRRGRKSAGFSATSRTCP